MGSGNRTTEFYKLAWQAPCGGQQIMRWLRQLVIDLHGPAEVIGFKEIRYGYEPSEQFAASLNWIRRLLPETLFILNTRQTHSCLRSEWWAHNPIQSWFTLNAMRRKFERYYREHADCCYWMPYEELRHGSAVLRGLFEFLKLSWRDEYERPLDVVLR